MDYKNGKIYTIRSHQTDQFYIGSTTQPLSKRLYCHKANYKCYINGKYHFVSSFEIIKYEDAYIELLEEYPCENKLQLHKREGELIRDNNCCNKRIAGRTSKEHYKDNKDLISKQNKEYYEQNKDKINETIKIYYNLNKDKLLQQKKEYYEQNKDKINEKITCECGCNYTRNNKKQHLQSQKHQNYLTNLS